MANFIYAATLICIFHYGSATYSHNVGSGLGGSYGSGASYGGGAYHGPLAAPVVLSNGHLADTNEVAAAKSAHYAALSSAKASSGYGGGYGSSYGGGYGGSAGFGSASSYESGSGYGSGASYGGGAYQGPLAAPVVLSSGYLADTRDVAAAKTAHYSAFLSAKSSSGYGNGLGSGYGGGYGSGGSYGSGADYGSGAGYGGGAYHGPLAAPVVLSSGYLADTRDVAAAKGAHYVALSKASSGSGYSGYSGSQGKGWK